MTAKGILKIDLSDSDVNLILSFERSDEGDQWSAENIRSSISKRGVVEPVSDKKIDAFLKAIQSAREPISMTVLTGIPPQLPKPEAVEWNAIDPPEGFTSIVEAVLDKAPKPEISREISEKIKKTKEVTVKPKIPFGQPKSETVEYTETVTRAEKVYINPEVRKSGYVEKGAVLGTVEPQDMGLPGKSLLGKTIPVKQLADPFFYAGANVSRGEQELRAEETGIVRIGRNWVDIVPFHKHEWSVEISPDRATIFLSLDPGSREAPRPEGTDILQAVRDMDYPLDSLMSATEIQELIEDAVRTGSVLTDAPLSTSRDAGFDIVISEDKLNAVLNIHKGKGRGNPLKLKEVGTAIKESGLKPLDFEKIKDEINAFYRGPDFDLTGYVLCEGTAPTTGAERGIEFGVTFDTEEKTTAIRNRLVELAKEHQETGTTCADSIDEFPPESIMRTAVVASESLLLTIDPEAPGETGVNVYGAQIPSPPGPVPELALHENVELKKNVVVSKVDGVFDYGEIDGVHHLRVRPHQDAVVTVDISPDRREATISMADGSGTGLRLSRALIDKVLEEGGVRYGLDEVALEKGIQAAKAGTHVRNLTIARAKPPRDQSDHQVDWLITFADGSHVKIRRDGTADYKNQDSITSVEAGQNLCRILPSDQEAENGTDVLGNEIEAKVTSGTPIDAGANVSTHQEEDGSTLMKASTAGELLFEKNRLDIRTVHTIKGDVNMAVGNVEFSGNVEIGGTVRSGFFVMSGGDIKIGGGVEGALLSSDGDIYVKLGVKGGGKAVLRSKKNILTTFIELATVLSVGNVVLKSALVRSRVKCNGTVMFQGDKGRIVGGEVRSKNGFLVQTIGSPRGVKTRVSFGQDYLISDLIDKEEKEIGKIKKRISQVDIEMRTAQRAGSKEKLEKLRIEKVKLLKLLEKRGLRLFTLRERFEEHFPSKIVIKETAFAGTVFESHGRTYELTANKKAIQVEFDPRSGTIGILNLKGDS